MDLPRSMRPDGRRVQDLHLPAREASLSPPGLGLFTPGVSSEKQMAPTPG
jgi:hypothetical protein